MSWGFHVWWRLRRRPQAERGKPEALHAKEVGRDAEQDQRLQDLDEAARDSGISLHDRTTRVERTKQDRCKEDADRAAQAQQRHRDGIETGGVVEVLVGQVVVDKYFNDTTGFDAI